ncbi:PQQ-dependent sugar dehydrogenase [Candidatus Gottesmanbacteria bacterium]|nr:PQQ-dependent sugar dehydrogenase [Candidatus Gottesmanbacteria bacterium]
MKKILYVTIVFGVMLGSYYGYRFYYQNLRGIGPAILPSARNMDQLLEEQIKRESSPESVEPNTTGLPLILPTKFSISVFAKDLGGPRVLAWDPNGVLLASIPSQGRVVSILRAIGEFRDDQVATVVEGLNRPHGIAFLGNTLYIAETNAVATYDYDVNSHKATNRKKIIDLPEGGNHFSRTIGFGPDGRLYIAVGSSCNVCNENDWRRAKILVANADGSDLKEYATGLRNSVFFTWHPLTGEMWATEMGRDLIGDGIPPDEINLIKEGANYGWPYCYGKNVTDLTFSSKGCQGAIASHIDLQAHSAPLGLAFIPNRKPSSLKDEGANKIATAKILTPSLWPEEYLGDLLVAYHGSWNRSTPTGYKVVRMKLDSQGNYEGIEDFITGWLGHASAAAGALGRPVDLLFDQKGNLYISDDKAGVIYRVTFHSFE